MNKQNLKDLTILYAEDDEDTRKATTLVLEDYVGKILAVQDGSEAIEAFKNNEVDIVLTDILMPKVNGLELAKSIRNGSKKPNTPIVITTAHTETNYLLEAIAQRVDGYIVKPIILEDLIKTLNKVVLPRFQEETIQSQTLLINAISTFVGGKKIEIIRFLLERAGEDHIFRGSYEEIIQTLNVSKPTVVKTFKQLIDTGLLTKIKNKVYKLHSDIAQNKEG